MVKQALEVVEFELNDGVTTEAFLKELQRTKPYVSSMNGFIERHTAQNDDGLWIDVVKWRDVESAKEAAKQFASAEEIKGFVMMLNHATIKMQHFEVQDSM